MKVLLILITMFFTMTTFAGVAVRDVSGGTSTYKGVYSDIKCEFGLDCSKAGAAIKIKTNPVKTITTFTSGDTTPSVANNTYFYTHTNALAITAFDDGLVGQEIIVVSKGAITFDVTSTTLKCGTTDIITAANDVSRWVYDGTNWICLSRVKASGDMN